MYCLACGKPLAERAVVCSVCGTHQKATPSPGWAPQEVRVWSSGEVPGGWVGPKSPQPLERTPQTVADNRPPPDPPRGRMRPPPGVMTGKKSNILGILVLGFMGLLFLLLVLSNWYMKNNVESNVLKLPSGMQPCVEAVTTLRSVVGILGKNLTETQLKKDAGYKAQVSKCPALKAKKGKSGWQIWAQMEKDDGTKCRIWADPGQKVTTDCDRTVTARP